MESTPALASRSVDRATPSASTRPDSSTGVSGKADSPANISGGSRTGIGKLRADPVEPVQRQYRDLHRATPKSKPGEPFFPAVTSPRPERRSAVLRHRRRRHLRCDAPMRKPLGVMRPRL
jgi:hypothetical protein